MSTRPRPDRPTPSIGRLHVPSPLFLAPMRQVSTVAFRRLCREHGAGLVFSECMRAGVLLAQVAEGRAPPLVDRSDAEGPVGAQISATEPGSAAEATDLVLGFGYALVDLNFGCPQISRRALVEGAALMRHPDVIGRVVEAVVRAARGAPVTVKIRAGADPECRNAAEVARVAEGAGASAITVHGRTGTQGYTGRADWGVIAAVRDAVAIPVVGNGDVCTVEDVARMFQETGVAFVMIGRGSYGNPWLFERANTYLRTGVVPPEPALLERARAWARYLELARESQDFPRGIIAAAYRYESVVRRRGDEDWGPRASPLGRTRPGRLLLAARRGAGRSRAFLARARG